MGQEVGVEVRGHCSWNIELIVSNLKWSQMLFLGVGADLATVWFGNGWCGSETGRLVLFLVW